MPPEPAAAVAEIPVVVVGYRNAGDIAACLSALARATPTPAFDVFICENGGADAYARLVDVLTAPDGPCTAASQALPAALTAPFVATRGLTLEPRGARVHVGLAPDNLGYAGGINAWLRPLLDVPGWTGMWILNPDTEPAPDALAALVERAARGGKGMVGSTIVDVGATESVRFRGGLAWQRARARGVAIGLGERVDAPHDLAAIEVAMASPSGSSMYVTRACLDRIGPMDERYFLFFEDLDWGLRARGDGLGYAPNSIVAHKRGTSTGSARRPAEIPRLSVYLEHRNGVLFVRRHFPWTLPSRIAMSFLYALRFLAAGAPSNCLAALAGVAAGLRGESGRPHWHRKVS